MGKRKLLKNIANGTISSFISRNNDVSGFWGIGKLYSLMIASKIMTVKIDLIKKTIEPRNDEFKLLVNKYSEYLFCQMKKQGLKEEYLFKAIIEVRGITNKSVSTIGRSSLHKMHCKIIIENDLGKTHMIKKSVLCRKHNPQSE
jgi:hypothetical protein